MIKIPPNKNKIGWAGQDELIAQTLEYLDDNFNALLDKADAILSSLPSWYIDFQVNKVKRIAELRFEETAANYAESVAGLDAIYQEFGTQYFLAYKIYRTIDPIYNETHPMEHKTLLRIMEIAPGKVVTEMQKYKEQYDILMKYVEKDIKTIDESL